MGAVVQFPALEQTPPVVSDFASYSITCSLGPARLIGLVTEISETERGPVASLWLLRLNKLVKSPLSECRKVSHGIITEGLLGLYATGASGDRRRVVKEMVIDGLLHVVLRDKDGKVSLPISIQDIKLTYVDMAASA